MIARSFIQSSLEDFQGCHTIPLDIVLHGLTVLRGKWFECLSFNFVPVSAMHHHKEPFSNFWMICNNPSKAVPYPGWRNGPPCSPFLENSSDPFFSVVFYALLYPNSPCTGGTKAGSVFRCALKSIQAGRDNLFPLSTGCSPVGTALEAHCVCCQVSHPSHCPARTPEPFLQSISPSVSSSPIPCTESEIVRAQQCL